MGTYSNSCAEWNLEHENVAIFLFGQLLSSETLHYYAIILGETLARDALPIPPHHGLQSYNPYMAVHLSSVPTLQSIFYGHSLCLGKPQIADAGVSPSKLALAAYWGVP